MAVTPEMLPGPDGPQVDPYFGVTEAPATVPGSLPGDLYPTSTDDYSKLLNWCLSAFTAAESARRPYEERWERYYKLYRSYVKRDPKDWHSRVFIPICFWIIETIVPRLVAQLPKFTCTPMQADDVNAAKKMETLLDWAVDESDLFVELVKAFKSSLRYGTGIIKTYYRVDKRRARRRLPLQVPLRLPQQVPVIDPMTGMPALDLDDNPIVETKVVDYGMLDVGAVAQKYTYTGYDGPAAECIDLFNFWVAPEAQDMDSARYVVHRTFREASYVMRRVDEGVYRLPEGMDLEQMTNPEDDPHLQRLSAIGLSAPDTDPNRRQVELLEFWTDDGRVITLANRKAILRVQENPFDHSEKPFVRIVDYLAEHEFWGIGEIEPLEGLQDLQNALVNSRIDNIKLVLNAMFAVNTQNLVDLDDLQMQPGGVIRLKGDLRPEEVIQRVELGDVTASAFSETEINERTIEKVSGVSAYQMGLDSPSLNNTATGVAIIQEQGASRFGLKSKMAELLGLKRLARHYGSIIQQFISEEKTIRLVGDDGVPFWETFQPESIYGALDYDIQSESTTQTQTVRVEQKQNLLSLVAQFAPQGVQAALSDVLDAMGIKDKEKYLGPMVDPMLVQQFMAQGMDPMTATMMAQQMGATQGMGADPTMMPSSNPMDPMGQMAQLGGDPTQGTPGAANADRMLQDIASQYLQGGQI